MPEIDRGPRWENYVSNEGEIDPVTIKKSWKAAYDEYMEEIIEQGRDYGSNFPPSKVLLRKTDI